MDGNFALWGILLFSIFVIINVIFYGYGAALQEISGSTIAKRAEKGDKKSIRILTMIKNPNTFIYSLHIVVTLFTLIIGAYIFLLCKETIIFPFIGSAVSTITLLEDMIIIFVVGVLILFVQIVGIVLPKKLAIRNPESWVYQLVNLVCIIMVLIKPLTFIVSSGVWLLFRVFGIDLNADEDNLTEEEIMSMVNEGHEQGVLLAEEAEMITNIFEFGDKEAHDIMTHRTSIVAINGRKTLKEAVHFILEENYSRIPVYQEDIDDIIGILHLRDAVIMLENKQDNGDVPIDSIPDLLRNVFFIPETRKINILFKEMQFKKIHMVVVVDEYGQIAGILTMEDILEEIVGNILDEYDDEEQFIIKKEDGSIIMDGRTPLDEAAEVLDIKFDEDDYETVNGFLIFQLNRIPQEYEMPEIVYQGYLFQILEMENKMIHLIKVTKRKK